MSVKKTLDRTSDLKKALKALAKSQVLVGIPASSSDNAREDGPITNSELGFIHEFGAPEANIPARPFLVPGVKASWEKANKLLASGAQKVLQLNPNPAATVTRTLEEAGLLAQGEVVQQINEGIEPPLADSTLKARARRGDKGAIKELENRKNDEAPSTSDVKPLIDSGQLKQSITYVVKDATNR